MTLLTEIIFILEEKRMTIPRKRLVYHRDMINSEIYLLTFSGLLQTQQENTENVTKCFLNIKPFNLCKDSLSSLRKSLNRRLIDLRRTSRQPFLNIIVHH